MSVPKLRFLEFRDKKEWDSLTIGDIGLFYYGKSAPKWSLEANAPTLCVRYGELYTKFGVIIDKIYSRTNINPQKLVFSKGGEILVPRVGEKPEDFGKCCCYLPFANIAIGEMISVFETNENPIFYTYYFRNMYKQFAEVVEGQNVKNLYYTELQPLPIFRTSIPEQQKIADCLTSLDELIAAHNQKLAALKTHKKGLMQQLFPAEGETVPKLRFPEFMDKGEWEEKAIGSISTVITGNTPRTSERSYYGTVKMFVSPADMSNTRYVTDTKTKLSALGIEQTRKIPAKSIMVVCIGSTIGKIAQNTEECATNQQINSIIPMDRFVGDFLYTNLERNVNKVIALAGRQAVPIVNKSQFSDIKLSIPCQAEQQKIAACLSSLDKLITAQTQKIETLKQHKKGLMQQLFPATDGESV